MRIVVSLVIQMSDDQVEVYADEYALPRHDGRVRARDVVTDVRSTVLAAVQGSPAFHEGGADITIKEN